MRDELSEAEMGELVKTLRRASAPQRYQARLVLEALATCDRIEHSYTHEGEM